jgi:hypothetical protein
MRNEDEDFATIIKEEFDEQWSPPQPAPTEPEPSAPPQQQPPSTGRPDFHMDIYDDEEGYRQVDRSTWRLSRLSVIGAVLIAVALVIGLARGLRLGLPSWTGWIAVACFLAGIGAWVWHLTQAHHGGDGSDAVV